MAAIDVEKWLAEKKAERKQEIATSEYIHERK
jgi:hypothetical protein